MICGHRRILFMSMEQVSTSAPLYRSMSGESGYVRYVVSEIVGLDLFVKNAVHTDIHKGIKNSGLACRNLAKNDAQKMLSCLPMLSC